MNKLSLVLCLQLVLVSLRAEKEFTFQHSVEIIEGEEYMQTPFGLMLKECIQNVPSGTFVEELEDGSINLTNDQQNFAKKILKNDRCSQINPIMNLKQWDDSIGYTFPKNMTLRSFEANYRVPNNPQTTKNQVLYYFIGSMNYGGGPYATILQPILIYHLGWYFQSWSCCTQGQAINAKAVYGINPYDTIYGSITVQNNVATIISTNKALQSSVLSIAQNNLDFNYIDATLEVHDISACSDFPTDYLEYSNMNVTISVQPSWGNNYGKSECNGQLTVINPSTIKIQHNLPAQEKQ